MILHAAYGNRLFESTAVEVELTTDVIGTSAIYPVNPARVRTS